MENVLYSSYVMSEMGKNMAKCPKCGKEVSTPKKTWKMAGRKDKSGKRLELTIGLFEHCGKSFRSVLNKRKI
jgi:adenine-specific DNA methylase